MIFDKIFDLLKNAILVKMNSSVDVDGENTNGTNSELVRPGIGLWNVFLLGL